MNVNDILHRQSGLIGTQIRQETLATSIWLRLVPRDTWPDEMGAILDTLTYERSLPGTTPTWSNVGINDGTGNNCVPAAEQVDIAQTIRNYQLQHTALESPDLCVNDLRTSFRRKRQLEAVYDVLKQNTSWLWQEHYRDNYALLSENHTVMRENFPTGTTMPLQVPTSRLTQGYLDVVYQKLVRMGAGDGAIEVVDGQPQFILVTSAEASNAIKMEVNGSSGIREDYRQSDRAKELLGPLGMTKPYRGFMHYADTFPPRYEFVGGAWVKIEPYISAAATKGNKFIVNPAWEDATYEDSFVFIPEVFTCLVPKPVTNPGGNTKFDPVDYMGHWSWKNIPHRTENPDGNVGFFRAVFSDAAEPKFPNRGFVIRHLRQGFSNKLLAAVDS